MIAEHVPEASVLFADLEGFTRYSETRAPADLIAFMDRLFGEFDRLADQHGVEKIKTMGDGYLVAAGLEEASANHAASLCALGADMIRAVDRISSDEGLDLGLRVGVHSGQLVAGVMGRTRPHFDIWGGTVNMAHRLQATARRNTIQITRATRDHLEDMPLTPRGEIEMKGLGRVPCWQITPQG